MCVGGMALWWDAIWNLIKRCIIASCRAYDQGQEGYGFVGKRAEKVSAAKERQASGVATG